MDIDTLYTKRLEVQVEEAKELARKYYERFEKKPEEEIFHEYFMLFRKEQFVLNNIVFNKKINLCDNRIQSIEYIKKSIPKFQDYDEFRRYCFDEKAE